MRYTWKVTKSGPLYGIILVSKENKGLFPQPAGDGKTKRSPDFALEYKGERYAVFLEQVGESNYRIWGRRGQLRKLYRQLEILTDDAYKIDGTLIINKDADQYTLEYDPVGETVIYLDEDQPEVPVDDLEELNEKEAIDALYDQYRNKKQIVFVTFHPSFSYEEFIEGIRPDLERGTIGFQYHTGVFKDLCLSALNALLRQLQEEHPDADLAPIESWKDFRSIHAKLKEVLKRGTQLPSTINHVIVIDEINRGDVSKVFGELISLIEEDKRIGTANELTVTLPYTGDLFGVPPNVYILATMNTADRSLALIDVALRRRFTFKEMKPALEDLRSHPENYGSAPSEFLLASADALLTINHTLSRNEDIGKDKQIGHAFLCNIQDNERLLQVWLHKILPLLEEYYYYDKSKLEELGGEAGQWYSRETGWTLRTEEEVRQFCQSIMKEGRP